MMNMNIKYLIPELITNDICKTMAFYTGILKFNLIAKYPDENPQWVKFRIGNSYIMFETAGSLAEIIPQFRNKSIDGSFNIYLEVEDIERMYADIKDKVDVILPLIEKPFRQFAMKDVNGYILLAGQHN